MLTTVSSRWRILPILTTLVFTGSALGSIPQCVDYAEGLQPVQTVASFIPITCLEAGDGLLVAAGGEDVSVYERSASGFLQLLDSVTVGAEVLDLTVQGSLAVVALGLDGLAIVDLMDPSSPTVVGSLAPGTPVVSVSACEFPAMVVAITEEGILRVIDVSVPESPMVVGEVATGQMVRQVACGPSHAYLAGEDGLQTVDLSDLSNPVVVDVIDDAVVCHEQFVADFRGLSVADGKLFAAGTYWFEWSDEWSWYYAEGSALNVFSLEDPGHPAFVIWAKGDAGAVELAADSAFAVDGDKLSVFNPEDLALQGVLPVDGTLQDVAAIDHFLYLAAGSQGIQVIDATYPQTVVAAATFGTEGGLGGGDARYTYSWQNTSNGNWMSFIYRIYSLADPLNPVVVRQGSVGGMNTNPAARMFDVQDDYVCFGATSYANGPMGSSLYDFSVSPYLSVPLPGTAEFIMLDGTTAWMSSYGELRAISFSNFSSPVEVGNLDTSSGNLQRFGPELVLLGSSPMGMQFLDLSDPTDPRAGPFLSLPNYPRKGAWHQGNLVLVLNNQQLAVVDPLVPDILSTIPLPEDNMQIFSTGEVVILILTQELWVLSLADASSPVWLAEAVPLPCSCWGGVAQDQFIYLSNHESGPLVYDLTIPEQPTFLGASAGPVGYLHLGDGYLRASGGVYPWHCSPNVAIDDPDDPDDLEEEEIPTSPFALAAAVPNPFNPATELRFSLNNPGLVELNVYDLNGRLVRNLVSQEMPSGNHFTVWNGRDNAGRQVPSGVYFAWLRTADGVTSRKLALIK